MSKDCIKSKGESQITRRYDIHSIGPNTEAAVGKNALVTHNGKQIEVDHLYNGKYAPASGRK